MARLRGPGLEFEEAGAHHTIVLDAVSTPDALERAYDFALVAVKSPFHRVALEPLAHAGVARAFVSLGNGLIQDALARLVGGPDNLLACLVEWAGSNRGPGRLVRDTIGPMVVGELDGSERERTRLLARCLERVGDVRITGNIRGQIWSKLLVNTAFTGLSAVSGLRYGEVAAHPDGAVVAPLIWAEGVRVGEAEGLSLETVLDVAPHDLVVAPGGERRTADAALARMMAIAGNSRPSMLQDLEHRRATEVDVINGAVSRRGRVHGVATPLNDRVVEVVHAMERGERSPAPEVLTELAGVFGGGQPSPLVD